MAIKKFRLPILFFFLQKKKRHEAQKKTCLVVILSEFPTLQCVPGLGKILVSCWMQLLTAGYPALNARGPARVLTIFLTRLLGYTAQYLPNRLNTDQRGPKATGFHPDLPIPFWVSPPRSTWATLGWHFLSPKIPHPSRTISCAPTPDGPGPNQNLGLQLSSWQQDFAQSTPVVASAQQTKHQRTENGCSGFQKTICNL